MAPPRADGRVPIDERLRTEPTVWLSSIRPDGRPHVVPVWFTWDGAIVDLFSKPNAQKVRNVRAHPEVMLAIGRPEAEWDVELIEGTASVLDEPTASRVSNALFEKYAALMARAELDRPTFVDTYSQPVAITPTRFVGYGGKGWTDPSLTPDGDTDVTGHLLQTSPHAAMLAEMRRIAGQSSDPVDLLALDD
jgi:PPOX class probable F420-dependent enzyme